MFELPDGPETKLEVHGSILNDLGWYDQTDLRCLWKLREQNDEVTMFSLLTISPKRDEICASDNFTP